MVNANLDDDLMWLDVDTGGGELMDSFKHPEHKTVVTEGWEPNFKHLREKYAASGVTVIVDKMKTCRTFRIIISTSSPIVMGLYPFRKL